MCPNHEINWHETCNQRHRVTLHAPARTTNHETATETEETRIDTTRIHPRAPPPLQANLDDVAVKLVGKRHVVVRPEVEFDQAGHGKRVKDLVVKRHRLF